MKYVDEYRQQATVEGWARALGQLSGGPFTLMEVCGGQTHTIVKYGLDRLLPANIELIHGPGCPVCVTSLQIIDCARELALRPEVIFCSFGDMLRVPGTQGSLLSAKAQGADVRIVYSPLQAVALARQHPERQVVFFAVGFETTAPAHALAVQKAAADGLQNLSLLVSHVLVPPAIEAILAAASNRVQGFLAAGHVCTVMGWEEYLPLAAKYRVPLVVTGFEPVDILQGVHMTVSQLRDGRAEVENQYVRSVRREGSLPARAAIREVFEVVPRRWRGIGEIPASGLGLRAKYGRFDALRRFGIVEQPEPAADGECQSGRVLTGAIKPPECPAFGVRCTPERPLGAPMVSSEGACAAYFQYREVSRG